MAAAAPCVLGYRCRSDQRDWAGDSGRSDCWRSGDENRRAASCEQVRATSCRFPCRARLKKQSGGRWTWKTSA